METLESLNPCRVYPKDVHTGLFSFVTDITTALNLVSRLLCTSDICTYFGYAKFIFTYIICT